MYYSTYSVYSSMYSVCIIVRTVCIAVCTVCIVCIVCIAVCIVYITSQNTMYCGGEPEHHTRNVTSRIYFNWA